MKANGVIFSAPNQVEFGEVTCPEPGPDDVVVQVTHSWISNGTEGSYLRGERIDGDTPYRPGDPWPFPIISGYQKVGVVDWIGKNVEHVKVGETVFAIFGQVEGLFDKRAGHASPSVTPRGQVLKLPPEVDPVAFSGLVLTQVGYNCGSRGSIAPGDGVVVIGDGLVGQWTAQTWAWRGARVALVGRHDDRLARFGSAGDGHQRINAGKVDWPAAVKELFPDGVQAGVDTVGSLAIIDALFEVMRRDGHLVSAGFYGTADQVALQPLRYKELSIHLPSGATAPRLQATIEMIAAGHLQTLPLITHRFPVQQAAQAWELIRSKREPVLGVILEWT